MEIVMRDEEFVTQELSQVEVGECFFVDKDLYIKVKNGPEDEIFNISQNTLENNIPFALIVYPVKATVYVNKIRKD